jgi:G3E family GTPase
VPDLTYNQLLLEVDALQRQANRDREEIHMVAAQIDEEATDTARIADLIGAMKVDPATVAETRELAQIMAGVSESALQQAATAENTSTTARAAYDTAVTSHSGIQEAINRANVDGLYDISPDWFEQQ